MSVTTKTPHGSTRLDRVRHRLGRCDRSRRTATRSSPVNLVVDPDHEPARLIHTPAGPEAAERALDWLAGQARWQSRLAELERP